MRGKFKKKRENRALRADNPVVEQVVQEGRADAEKKLANLQMRMSKAKDSKTRNKLMGEYRKALKAVELESLKEASPRQKAQLLAKAQFEAREKASLDIMKDTQKKALMDSIIRKLDDEGKSGSWTAERVRKVQTNEATYGSRFHKWLETEVDDDDLTVETDNGTSARLEWDEVFGE